MTPRTAENATDLVQYIRTWRVWRLCFRHLDTLNQRMYYAATPEELFKARDQIARYRNTMDRIWERRQELKQKLEEAGIDRIPD